MQAISILKPQQLSNAKVVLVPARDLIIHPRAQRALRQSRVDYLCEHMDLDAIGVLHGIEFVLPSGKTVILLIDGQHRQAALLQSEFGEWLVQVMIHMDVKTDAHAAELFLRLSSAATIGSYDKFNQGLLAQHEVETGVNSLVTQRALRISRTNSTDGTVRCVNALCAVFRLDGGQSLIKALDTLLGAWGRNAAAFDGSIVEGLGRIYKTHGDNIDQRAMVKRLANYAGGAAALLGDARGMRERRSRGLSVSQCVAQIVAEQYNKHRTSNKLEIA